MGATPAAAPEQPFKLADVEPSPDIIAVRPARLLDTRPGESTTDGTFSGLGRLDAGSTLQLSVSGRGGLPDSGVTGVMLNIATVRPADTGYITVEPCGRPSRLPQAAHLSYRPGAIDSNAVFAKLGDGGTVCIFSRASTDLVVDLSGFTTAASRTMPIAPIRLADSRPDGATVDEFVSGRGSLSRLEAGSVLELPVWRGRDQGVPVGAAAVVLNVAAIDPDDAGYITAYPCDAGRPTAAHLNYERGGVTAKTVFAATGGDGSVCIYTRSATHLVVDATGYSMDLSGAEPLLPARLLDTRSDGSTIDGRFVGGGELVAGRILEVDIAGRGGVPFDGASSVMLNVAAVDPEDSGYITVYACDADRPVTANVNYRRGGVHTNAVFAALDEAGRICLYARATTDVVVDVSGVIVDPAMVSDPGPEIDLIPLAAGWTQACAITSDRTIACWGDGPAPPAGAFVALDSYGETTCGLRVDGTAVCWNSPFPAGGGRFTDVAVGAFHVCGLRADGRADCWSDSAYAGAAAAPNERFVELSAGFAHTCGILTDGSIACWGDLLAGLASTHGGSFVALDSGEYSTCAIRDAGTIDCWGADWFGQSSPPPGTFTDIATSPGHACALGMDLTVTCWGADWFGQSSAPAGSFSAVDAGDGHTCAARTDRSIACWGDDTSGQSSPPDVLVAAESAP